jgi:hypothetical protein
LRTPRSSTTPTPGGGARRRQPLSTPSALPWTDSASSTTGRPTTVSWSEPGPSSSQRADDEPRIHSQDARQVRPETRSDLDLSMVVGTGVDPVTYRFSAGWGLSAGGRSCPLVGVCPAGALTDSTNGAVRGFNVVGGEGLQQQFRPAPYFELITYMMLAFGVGFEFPIVLVFLQLAGVVTAPALRSARRYAVVGIVVVVAVITPSGDPYTLGILSIPMHLLYEASILIGMLLTRRSDGR